MSKSRGRGHSSRQQEREELARKLREWAVGEMGLSEQGGAVPSHGDLQVLIKGNFSNPWEHVVAHVRAPRTAEVVRKNIRLHSSGDKSGGMEEEQLHAQRAQLARELSSLRLAVAQLEVDAERLQSDIHQRVTGNVKTKVALAELSQKSVLLSANSVKCKETVRVLNEFSRRIHQRMEIFRHLPGEASYFARSSAAPLPNPSGGSKPVVLESACTREVRKACNQVEEVVGLLYTQESGPRSEQMERAQEQAWNKTEALLCHHPPCDIIASLTEVTQDGGAEIHQHTAAIDLERDAEQLKYKVEPSGGMKDVAQKTNLLHSVEEHLLEAQLSHIRRSVESEHAQKAATEVQKRLLEVKGHLEQLLSMQYGSDAEGLDLARTHLWLELEEAGGRAAVQTLSSLCASLSFSRDQRRMAIEHLHQKHKRITEFTQAAEVRQAQIGALVKLNSAARDRLRKQRTELELYMKESVCAHEVQLVSLANALQDGMWHEVQLFSTLSLARLMKPPGLSAPVCELSVSRLSPIQPSGAPSWEGVLRALGLPSHAAPEEVIPQLSGLFRRVEVLCQEVERSEEVLRKMREGGVDRKKAEDILAAVQQYDRQQMAKGIPALKQCLSQAAQSMAESTTVQKTMQEWWEQPALSLTPWLNYEGMDVQQWARQWRVLTTKLRQLSAM